MKKDITLYYNAVCKEHSYDNGFCTKCGGYQPADYNESTGSYEIGNGGQMFWFAALVNGDGEHTQIQEAKPDAHGALVSDISLKNSSDENYEWKPIGEFKGIFDGQNHTISDFSMTKVNDQSIGFFQNLMSDPNETDEAKKATLKNFTLNGTIVTTAEAASAVGGVVGTTSGGVIRRVNSNVNIGSGLIYYIGGIAGLISEATSIEESTNSGKIVLDFDSYGVGGIVGFVTDDDTYAGGTKIKDCANYGLITYYKVENHGGRGYSGGITGQVALGEEDFILSDCYNYGSVLAEEWKEIYGAISGYCAAKKDGIKNNYYLDTLPVKGFLGEAEIANDEELAKAKTAEQFKSGEEAYLLNNEVTDGSQVWYQNIGALSTKENGIAGGIVGKLDKNGSIQIAYSAQTAIEGGTTGAVFGTKEETAGAVNNTYYLDTLSGNEEQGTAKTAAEMKSNAFKEELNTLVAGNEELCSWTWNSTKNQGYPRILSSLITEVELVNASRGLTVKGMMHKDTKLQLNELDKKNDIYQAFKKYAQKTDKQVLYSAEPTLVYEDGQPSAYEGNLNVKLDLSKYRGKGYKVLVYRNNQIEELEIDKQMIASKDVEEMVPFAVLAEKSEISKAVDHIKDTVKTGDNSSVILLFCIVVVAGSVAGGVIYWRKKKARK